MQKLAKQKPLVKQKQLKLQNKLVSQARKQAVSLDEQNTRKRSCGISKLLIVTNSYLLKVNLQDKQIQANNVGESKPASKTKHQKIPSNLFPVFSICFLGRLTFERMLVCDNEQLTNSAGLLLWSLAQPCSASILLVFELQKLVCVVSAVSYCVTENVEKTLKCYCQRQNRQHLASHQQAQPQ